MEEEDTKKVTLIDSLSLHTQEELYQFVNRDDTKPCQRAARAFLFGETELITLIDYGESCAAHPRRRLRYIGTRRT